MPTTTNNGWPTPADTDLVKNGADAIRDLGNAIDTTLGVYSPVTPGLVKINTTSFSAVNAVSLPTNTFSSTYTHYKTILEITTASTNDYVGARYRAAGSDISTAAYQSGFIDIRMNAATSSLDASGANQTTFTRLGYHLASQATYVETNWWSPNQAVSKGFTGTSMNVATDAGNQMWAGGNFDNTTVADSVSFFPMSGTFTGTLYCYAFNK